MTTNFIIRSKEELDEWATKEFGSDAILKQNRAYLKSVMMIATYGFVIIVKKPKAERAIGNRASFDSNQIPQSTH
jgi:hypothetical protein